MARPRAPVASSAWVGASLATHVVLLAVALHAGRARNTDVPVVPHSDAALAGETFEVPLTDPPEDGPAQTAGGSAAEARNVEAAPPSDPEGVNPPPVQTTHASSVRRRVSPSGTPGPGEAGASAVDKPGSFGAVGDRSAIDLATAFTRAFPQAASADPRWLAAPFGSAGTLDLTLTLDDSGALVDTRSSGSAGDALTEGVRRTLALIRARAFVAARRETRLRIQATVTKDDVHDGLHGEVFAIGGSFDAGGGNGFFALAVGRRVDIRVQVER